MSISEASSLKRWRRIRGRRLKRRFKRNIIIGMEMPNILK
jgi:hypothetical protein